MGAETNCVKFLKIQCYPFEDNLRILKVRMLARFHPNVKPKHRETNKLCKIMNRSESFYQNIMLNQREP